MTEVERGLLKDSVYTRTLRGNLSRYEGVDIEEESTLYM